jgi:hypothetical protein
VARWKRGIEEPQTQVAMFATQGGEVEARGFSPAVSGFLKLGFSPGNYASEITNNFSVTP